MRRHNIILRSYYIECFSLCVCLISHKYHLPIRYYFRVVFVELTKLNMNLLYTLRTLSQLTPIQHESIIVIKILDICS